MPRRGILCAVCSSARKKEPLVEVVLDHGTPPFQSFRRQRHPPSQCRCQGSNLIFELRGLACESGTLQRHSCSAPRRGIEPRLADSKSAVLVHHTCRASVSRPGLEPGSGPSESPMLSTAPSGHARADDWICTSMIRFTGPALHCSATSAKARARGVEPGTDPPGADWSTRVLEARCPPRSTLV